MNITCTHLESKGKGRKRKRDYSGELIKYSGNKVILQTAKGVRTFWISEISEYG
jgi:hypothetical protein